MGQKEFDKIVYSLRLLEYLNVAIFEDFIREYVDRKESKELALQELDQLIVLLQKHMLSLSLYIKSQHLWKRSHGANLGNGCPIYTKHEVALKYRVSLRTVRNWITDGLETIEIGGVKRISEEAVQQFIKNNRTKKFHWRSIARR
jgi:hypothetical protein